MMGPTSSEIVGVETTESSSRESVVVLDLIFLSFLAWLLLLCLSGADPTMSEGGGEPAREIPVDVPCSDAVGVDGRLREIEDKDGCLDACISTAADRVLERSVIADAGAASAFVVVGVVVVVSLRVLGLPLEIQSGDFVLLAKGVLGSDSIVVGVAAILCGKIWELVFEGDGPSLGFCAIAAEMSSFLRGDTATAAEEECLSASPSASGLEQPDVSKDSSGVSFAPGGLDCEDLGLSAAVFVVVLPGPSAISSAVVVSSGVLSSDISLVSPSDLGLSGLSFTFALGLVERCPIGKMGRAGVTGPGVIPKALVCLLAVSMSSARDGEG